eukprot:Nk52_evm27s252 gene=Nk52_evmTU27s252
MSDLSSAVKNADAEESIIDQAELRGDKEQKVHTPGRYANRKTSRLKREAKEKASHKAQQESPHENNSRGVEKANSAPVSERRRSSAASTVSSAGSSRRGSRRSSVYVDTFQHELHITKSLSRPHIYSNAEIVAHGTDHVQKDANAIKEHDIVVNENADNEAAGILTVSCTDLPSLDRSSASDPIAVLYRKCTETGKYVECQRSEKVKNSHSPVFNTVFEVAWRFFEAETFKFEFFDTDGKSVKLVPSKSLGAVEFELGEVAAAPGRYIKLPLVGEQAGASSMAKIIFKEVETDRKEVYFQLKGHKLGPQRPFWKKEKRLFFRFSHKKNDGRCDSFYSSEVAVSTTSPSWGLFSLTSDMVFEEKSMRTPITVDVYAYRKSGDHIQQGSFVFTVEKVLAGETKYEIQTEVQGVQTARYSNNAHIEIEECYIHKHHTFLDFIAGGCQINFTVCADFSEANGTSNSTKSLHHFDVREPNQYMRAIGSTANIIQNYDTDKLFPAYAIGCKEPSKGDVEFWPMNLSEEDPSCDGIKGLASSYFMANQVLGLGKECKFAPIINHLVSDVEHATQESQYYNVVLIITCGDIKDMNETKKAIVEASILPLSIVIVGVGNAKFKDMVELDGDVKGLQSDGVYAARDIVQFVGFKPYSKLNDPKLMGPFAAEVLEEIPHQFLEYMHLHGIEPNEAIISDDDDTSSVNQKYKRPEALEEVRQFMLEKTFK